MRIARTLIGLSVVMLFSGCSVAGTWVGQNTPDHGPKIARVTFAQDGTFTAEANYESKGTKAMSGHYTYDMMSKKLKLDTEGAKREYKVVVKGDQMIFDDGKATMVRFK